MLKLADDIKSIADEVVSERLTLPDKPFLLNSPAGAFMIPAMKVSGNVGGSIVFPELVATAGSSDIADLPVQASDPSPASGQQSADFPRRAADIQRRAAFSFLKNFILGFTGLGAGPVCQC
ncbi:hypothetical protein [Caballeronia arationis]|uniref:hypothetical protein n=1 Tax=Caballeronia arationis TaxID=1777142 RepID=UPI000787F8EF|nr:hypothetical protein [Caballeronia arationis]